MNEQTQNHSSFRVKQTHLVYVCIALGVCNLLGLYYMYQALITPPVPIDKQVAQLVKDSAHLWEMKKAIQQSVK